MSRKRLSSPTASSTWICALAIRLAASPSALGELVAAPSRLRLEVRALSTLPESLSLHWSMTWRQMPNRASALVRFLCSCSSCSSSCSPRPRLSSSSNW
ncbi:hypothetical protein D9M73_234160 [compost metagenome]